MDATVIFSGIKEAFCSLWTFKMRGKTLEIVTPYSTTTSKFISIFITQQENKFVVTDGGWLNSGEYDSTPDYNDDMFMRIFSHYESFYQIRKLENSIGVYYFKTTNKQELIPNLVYDLTNFLSNIVSTTQIQFVDEKEKQEKETFRRVADSFMTSFVYKDNLQLNKELSEDYKSVRFNAIISRGPKINLVKYVTGSTSNYFLSSLAKATVDFEIANHSPYNDYISNRIVLLNNTAEGFVTKKIFRYIETLQEHTKLPPVYWTNKEDIKHMLN